MISWSHCAPVIPSVNWSVKRVIQAERMDDPALNARTHHAALKGLTRLNWFSGSAGILWNPISALASSNGGKLRILDVATGAGDVPISLWKRGRKAGLLLEIEACDVSPVSIRFARDSADAQHADITF